ncbi:hypothetical protein C8Q74DRAFT_851049 [Fomes fomentarius]|nr:hypothetical protein C8Q74DRAFT_851049 [Fomes fomentarius]
MSSPNNNAEWTADVKVAVAVTEPQNQGQGRIDPAVLPEYTLLPDSPSGSAVGPDDSASNAGAGESSADEARPAACKEGLRIFRLLWMGMLAIVLPPAIVAAAAVGSAAAMLYGCGLMLEGIGRGIAIGPELLYRGCVTMRAKMLVGAVRGRREGREAADVETGAIAI